MTDLPEKFRDLLKPEYAAELDAMNDEVERLSAQEEDQHSVRVDAFPFADELEAAAERMTALVARIADPAPLPQPRGRDRRDRQRHAPGEAVVSPAQFNETALFVRVLWSRARACYQAIGIDGHILFESTNSRLVVHVAEGFEDDYAGAAA